VVGDVFLSPQGYTVFSWRYDDLLFVVFVYVEIATDKAVELYCGTHINYSFFSYLYREKE
jgi:hypothetical protein